MLSTRHPAARAWPLCELGAAPPDAPSVATRSARNAAWQASHPHVVVACIVPALRRLPGSQSRSRMPSGELHVGSSVGAGSGSDVPARQHRHGV